MTRQAWCWPFVLLVVAFPAAAQQPTNSTKTPVAEPSAAEAGDKNAAQIDAALKLTVAAADAYEFQVGRDNPQRAAREAKPILRWSNPSVGEIHGNVFLWTVEGRPAVVSSIFKWFSPFTHMSHEFHSLSEGPVRAKYEGAEVWVVDEPGLVFAAAPEAPPPAAGKPQRLLQMREFARSCAATKRDREGNVTQLRLLTQPIYRYAAPQAGITDGALFAFVHGTDPEVFLLLEAREAGGQKAWQFAASRMNSVAFELKHQDRELWKVDAMSGSEVYQHRRAYTSFMHKMP